VWDSDGQIGSKQGIFIPLCSLIPKANPSKLLMPVHTILGFKEVGTMGTRVTTIEIGKREVVTRRWCQLTH